MIFRIKNRSSSASHLDVEVRRAVAVCADQDPVARHAQELLDGPAQGECLAGAVRSDDEDGWEAELGGRRDGPHRLPLLGVESAVSLPVWPLSGRMPGDRGRAECKKYYEPRKM